MSRGAMQSKVNLWAYERAGRLTSTAGVKFLTFPERRWKENGNPGPLAVW
jgi:hypothetical protein